MARAKKTKSLEATIWEGCCKLRNSIEIPNYKHVILSLVFLKYANDKFEQQREKLIDEGYGDFLEEISSYAKDNVFFVPECSRWDYLVKHSKQQDIALKIDTALHELELKNESLKGALPENFFSGLQTNPSDLSGMISQISKINLELSDDKDIFGRMYEYFLRQFANLEGTGKGEFYTPASVVSLLCELIEPYHGSVYDGALGSGGMFVQSARFIESHNGNKKDITVFGQEKMPTTRKLALMNLAIRGISADLGTIADSTFTNDQHKDKKADYILMNPPFNLKYWREEKELEDDYRWDGYSVPPTSNANYAWLLNAVSKLSQDGVCAIMLANGALSASGAEGEIREQMIKNDLYEAVIILPREMFYNTDISTTVYILNRNKKAKDGYYADKPFKFRNREHELLMIDLRTWNSEKDENGYVIFTEEQKNKIADIYHNWQSEGMNGYEDVPELCQRVITENKFYTQEHEKQGLKTVENYNFILTPSKYIPFVDKDLDINFLDEMSRIQIEMSTLLNEEKTSQKMLEDAFKGIGYELK